ncbi:MAG: DinB family protein [Bacillota bacterium]
MNPYCKTALHQIQICIETLVKMINQLEEKDLHERPAPDKLSVGELLEHIALICEADWRISNEASQDDMEAFYSSFSYKDLQSISEGLLEHFESLCSNYKNLSEKALLAETTSHWGVTYTRYEWLLEIVAHIYHHRGQLHSMLVHGGKDPELLMFE